MGMLAACACIAVGGGWYGWRVPRPLAGADGGERGVGVLPVEGGAAAPVLAGGAAVLVFERERVEVETAADAATAVVDFPFVNRSGRRVVIRGFESTCTCMEVQVSGGKLEYGVGEGGVIRAMFNLEGLLGVSEKKVRLFLEGDRDERPTHELVVRLKIPELVEFSEKTLKWEVGAEAVAKKVDLVVRHKAPLRVLAATCADGNFKVDLKVLEEGRRYALWVTPVQTAAPVLALVRVETDSAIPRQRVHQVFVLVREGADGKGGGP